AAALRPVPVSDVVGLRDDANPPAGAAARLNGHVTLAALRAAGLVATVVGWSFWPVTALLAVRAVVAVVAAVRHARSPRTGDWVGPVTVIVPAYNEAAGIADTVLSLVRSDWPWGLEVIVVDDGSTDGTGDIVERLGLPGVWVIRQPNGGKPAALNAAIAAARTEVVVLVDGDTVFRPDTVDRLVAPFDDPRVGAVSGNAKVWNRRSLLGRWQHIEYVMGFNLDRRLLALARAIPTVPGAVGAFRLAALRQVGGVSADTLAEDTDLTIAVTRAGWRVLYRDDAIAWTEAPFTTGDLWRQRYRWSYGTLQAVWKHRGALRERRSIGLVGLPYAAVFQVALPLLAPIVDVVAVVAVATGGSRAVLAGWVTFTLAQLALAAVAFRLDREPLGPLWAVPLQQVFYRQLMYLVVIRSVLTAASGTRLRWQKLRRLDAPSPSATPTFPHPT
ncbi:MAG TPA: glycosyltransferase family 2 protein, partial [Acidimicrobiales bacterium]